MGLELDAGVYTTGFQPFNVRIRPQFVNRAKGLSTELQRDKVTQFRDKDALLLNVRYKATLRLPVGVRNVIARYWAFSGKLTDLGHVLVYYKSRA